MSPLRHGLAHTLADLPTPAVVIDKSRVLRNIQAMQAAANAHGLRLRPHAKTHKSPLIGQWQLEAGAVGLACAKLGEAEVFADAGFTDIRLPYPLQPSNAARVLALLERGIRLSFVVDHLDVARGWSQVMTAARREVDVLVKVDVGFHRCGVNPALPAAADFVVTVARMPGLKLAGLLSHAGQSYLATSTAEIEQVAVHEARLLSSIAAAVRHQGVALYEVSVGATPTARFSLTRGGITELRPGNYVYFDRTQVGLGAATLDDCALSVVATVVSKPASDRLILDCGSKTLSSDSARGVNSPGGFGLVFSSVEDAEPDPDLSVERLSEEHAVVRSKSGLTRLEPGDRVRVLPNHSCVVSNLIDAAWLVERARVLAPLPIVARGRIT